MRIIATEAPDFDAHWRRLWDTATWKPALYGPLNLKFYEAYHDNTYTDHSVVIGVDKLLAGGLRVTSHIDTDGATVFSCFRQPTVYVEACGLDVVSRRRAFKEIQDYIEELTSRAERWRWEHIDYLEGGALVEFSRRLLSIGGSPVVVPTQMLDLAESDEVLSAGMTRTFRWCVTWGRKHIDVRLLDQTTIKIADIDAFRALHVEVAGRETRSYETWQRQYDMVRGGEAFLCLGSLEGNLVTAALFPYSADHCYYGVSASRRELFSSDKPLSHILIWRAITHARTLGCRWFEMGELRFAYQVPPPTEKELSIGTFKRNFGGRTFVRVRIDAEAGQSVA